MVFDGNSMVAILDRLDVRPWSTLGFALVDDLLVAPSVSIRSPASRRSSSSNSGNPLSLRSAKNRVDLAGRLRLHLKLSVCCARE
jgi:hypothetical protein